VCVCVSVCVCFSVAVFIVACLSVTLHCLDLVLSCEQLLLHHTPLPPPPLLPPHHCFSRRCVLESRLILWKVIRKRAPLLVTPSYFQDKKKEFGLGLLPTVPRSMIWPRLLHTGPHSPFSRFPLLTLFPRPLSLPLSGCTLTHKNARQYLFELFICIDKHKNAS
jgi:hypothetical protein